MTRLLLSLFMGVIGLAYVNAQAQQIIAEVYFVAEPQVLRNYMLLGYNRSEAMDNLKLDASYFIYQTNEFYKSFKKYGVDVQIRAKALDILTDQEVYPKCKLVNVNQIQADFGIEVFKEWLVSTKAHDKHKYDMAILWHGYEKFSTPGNTGTAGYAHVGAACDPTNGIGIVEYKMTQITALTTAHEIAHILGAEHDRNYAGKTCAGGPQDGFLMTPVSQPRAQNRWAFSQCSLIDILKATDTLVKNNKTCLSETTAPVSTFKMADLMGKDILDLDKICRRDQVGKHTEEVYFCQSAFFYNEQKPKGDIVCQYLYCGASPGSSCSMGYPTEGIVCDAGKRCSQGKCVAAPADMPTDPAIKSTCLYGNRNHGAVNGKPGNCAAFIKQFTNRVCAESWVSDLCCKDCEGVTVKPPTTPKPAVVSCNVDRNPRCPTVPNVCNNANNRRVCCFTCRNWVPVSKRDVDEDDNNDDDGVLTLTDVLSFFYSWYQHFITPVVQEEEPKDQGFIMSS